MSKYYYDKDFFQNIDTEEKAYWLGFLYADGCINQQYRNGKLKSMHLEIGLSQKDKAHLVKFKECLHSNVPIKNKLSKLDGKLYESSRIAVCCTKLCRDLCTKGCTPQKSLTLKFPNCNIIPNELIKHFIRGYFDGDGCVSVSNNIITINFVGTMEMLSGISIFLQKNNIIYKNPTIYQKGNAFEMFIYGADIVKQIFLFLYKDSSVYLERKYNKFSDFYKNYDLHRKSKSGKQGVYFNTKTQKWCATGYLNGNRKYLGSFKDKQDAILARKNFEIKKCRLKQ